MAATRRITGSLIGTMGIVTLLPFVQLDGLWKCIYDTFPGLGLSNLETPQYHRLNTHWTNFSLFLGLIYINISNFKSVHPDSSVCCLLFGIT